MKKLVVLVLILLLAPSPRVEMPQLLKNDALVKHPLLRRMPTTPEEWTRFIQTLNAQPVRNIGDQVQPLTPTWGGFSADPAVDLSYYDFGAIVMIWADALTVGTSDATTMTWADGSLPEAIRPSANRSVKVTLVDNGSGGWDGSADVTTLGAVIFSMSTVSGTKIVSSNTAFTNVGSKGIPSGAMLIYPK